MFEHSIIVPRLYKSAAKIAKSVKEDGASVKGLVYERKHPNIKALYALVVETLQRSEQINFLLKKSQLLVKEPRLDPWLARVLLTELLWRKRCLPGESKPVKTVLAYQQILNAHLTDIHVDITDQSNKVEKPRFVRINTIKLDLNDAIQMFTDEEWIFSKYLDKINYEGFLSKVSSMSNDEFMPDIHIENLLIFPSGTAFFNHHAYKNGLIFLQDKASCLPPYILNPQPGSKVLDMCAAPGMKTTQIAALMQDKGTVLAVEMDMKRMVTLDKMVESSGSTCIQTLNRDVLTVTAKDLAGIEYILVDPTCSGSGILDRVKMECDTEQLEQRLRKLAGFQIKILKHALTNFPDAKRVVYSTCSIYPQENEEVVREVISRNSAFKIVPAQERLDGRWKNFASQDPSDIGSYCIYAKPAEDLTNGFFVAVFERLQDGDTNPFFKPRIYTHDLKEGLRQHFKEKAVHSSEGISENMSENCTADMKKIKHKKKKLVNVDDVDVKSTKKKKHSSNVEKKGGIEATNESNDVMSSINNEQNSLNVDGTSTVSKHKSKKKRRDYNESNDIMSCNNNEQTLLNVDGTSTVSKHKSKKKRRDYNESNDIMSCNNNEQALLNVDGTSTVSKHKSKKKSSDYSEINKEVGKISHENDSTYHAEARDPTNFDTLKIKKKSKNKELVKESVEDTNNCSSMLKKKKKRSKAKLEDALGLELTNVCQDLESSGQQEISSIKSKKIKRKGLHAEIETEIVSAPKIKKRKKDRGRTVDESEALPSVGK